MRIREAGSGPGRSTYAPEKAQSAMQGAGSKTFGDVLQDNKYRSLEEELADIIRGIGEQGKRLGERLNLQELITYKRMIANFLNKIIEGMYSYKKDDCFDRWGRHNIYAVIKKIDSKLEVLTENVLNEEKDRLSVLGHVDDIRGMLMDLFL